MEPDTARPRDEIERAHLKAPGDKSHVMYRYPPPPGLEGLVQRFWIPVWSVPAGGESVQRVLQYPVSLLVVAPDYARFYGVTTGLSETTLAGEGWAVGVMCTPAAGSLVARGPMAAFTDRHVQLTDVLGPDGAELARGVRAAMQPDPHATAAHRQAMACFDRVLRPLLPVDVEGELVDRVVALVEQRPDLLRVAQLCAETGLSERALQRLVHRRLGLTPKWLVQRRRLQEAAERLRRGGEGLAETAAVLGYADQAHFVRDFSRVTGTTPGRFAAEHRTRLG
ncbi:helix-turn-helix domain-containing protein [Modestobacter sp. I12A-02628]|uniref:Helix-turn-helix transcriptional regulator n=1 Tax=Goekera deserti TaxID=2497753 RepID=A0A7K3WIR1_9ACTN|nr:AraC family transcriptional regulator [Goekera deserti]MPQ97121.1 helix-turn-helix domain-containing protein [Goekera deserti]NDI46561.1 helix-turn-helix domain-containing protein [Goekera deserti]NEL56317.1 helix-turn-helix transcriptional regulator [Goekera deserti]